MKRFYASLSALTLVVAGLLLFNFMGANSSAALPRDCDNNSIIYCGGTSSSELALRYNANKTGDLKTVYHSYGLSDYEMTHASTSAKMGEIHRDGRVTVNGEVVATGATSIGRQQLYANRTKVKIGNKYYYEGSPEYSYAKGVESIVAYVFFDKDGNFKAAVMTSCGNPVHAHPKPKPVYTCNALTAEKISRTERKFTASASAKNGATITSYTYDFGDGSNKTTAATTQSHTYTKPGTYTAKLTVNVKVNGQTKTVTGAKCQVNVTIETPPPTPEYLCNALTVDKIDRTHFKFSTDYTVTNATFKKVTYVIRDASGNEIASLDGNTYAQDKPATYSVQAIVTVDVNGKEKTATGESCKQQFTVTPPNKVRVCDQNTGKTITVEEKDQGKYKPVGDAACQPTPVELPHTGPAEIIGSTLGIGSLSASVGYYVASRRGLLSELLGR
jgi:PKD repeat protein